MISPYQIQQAILKRLKWLIVTNYGRFLLGIILAITGVFSQYGTIPLISTDWFFFEVTATAGILIMILQFAWVVFRSLYLYIYNKK